MPRIKSSEYIYAVSRIRAVEPNLISPAGLERMMEAETLEAAVKVLADAGYDLPAGECSQEGYSEKLLADEHKKLYRLLKEIAPQPEIFDLFLQPQDFHNIKVILKAEFMGMENFDKFLTNTGTLEKNKLKSILRERELEAIPDIMRQAVEETLRDFHHNRDPQRIDILLDKACYRRMRKIADSFSHDSLKNFVIITVDLLNIRILLRLKQLKKEKDFVQEALLPGGGHPPQEWLKLLDAPLQEFITYLESTPYREGIVKGVKSFRTDGNLMLLEKLSDNFLMRCAKKAKYRIEGLEPLIAYLIAKETEMKNVRMILKGKRYGIPRQEIRERLREVYV